MSTLELFGRRLADVRYLGADISAAVDVAGTRFAEGGVSSPASSRPTSPISRCPTGSRTWSSPRACCTTPDSTEGALHTVARAACGFPAGQLCYVYAEKGPVREFTDDLIRARLQEMEPEEAWEAMIAADPPRGRPSASSTSTLEIEEPIELLGVPAGSISLQRFFYWHVCKTYYRPRAHPRRAEPHQLRLVRAHATRTARRRSEVREWCAEAGLEIERERVEEAGITIVARRVG